MMRTIRLAFVALVFFASAYAENFFWGKSVVDALSAKSKDFVSGDSSPKNYFFAIKFLLSQQLKKNPCNCELINQKKKRCVTSKDFYFLVSSAGVCGCDPFNDNFNKTTPENFELFTFEILLENAQNRLSSGKVQAWKDELQNRIDGNLNSHELHAALEVVLALKANSAIDSVSSEIVSVASRRVTGSASDVLSDPTLLFYLQHFGGKTTRLSQGQVQGAVETLSNIKYAHDPEAYFKAYTSIVFLNSLQSAPRSIFLQSTVFQAGESVTLRLKSVDLLGSDVAITTANLISLKKVGKEVSNLNSNALVNGEIDLSGADLPPGRYISSFEVQFSDSDSVVKFQSPLLIQDKSPKIQIRAGVSESKQTSKEDLVEISKNSLFSGSASATSLEHFHVSVAFPRKVRLHQIALKFTSEDTGSSILFSARNDEEIDSLVVFRVSFGDEIEKFNYHSGTYAVSFIMGDLSLSVPVEWSIGHITLTFPAKPVINLPLYAKALLHTSDVTLQRLPEIEHQMRPPAKRASIPTSFLFTALVVLPLAMLIFSLLRLKPNLKRLSSLSSLATTALFSALLILYAGYWLGMKRMSFYETIKYLCFIYPTLVFFGRSSLISVMSKRLQSS